MNSLPPTTLYAQFRQRRSAKAHFRDGLRDLAVCSLGLMARLGEGNWLRFPYYHHVYDDERAGFARQLDFLKSQGEFLTLDDAVGLLESGQPVDGRYFCITFDDGLAGCRGAVEVLADKAIPAAFYVTADYLGRRLVPTDPAAAVFGFKGTASTLDFLSWDDCRRMVAAGMTIGSHTCNHVKLALLDDESAENELAVSKARIEAELGVPCHHFCAPWGTPDLHYRRDRDPALAKALGYRSFASGVRGPMRGGGDPFALTRDHLLANWHPLQLRYFFSRG